MSHQPGSHLRTINMWVHSKSKSDWFLVHCTKYWFIMNSLLKTSAWVLWACLVVIRTQWHWAVRMSDLFTEQFSSLNRVCCKLTSQFLCRILSSLKGGLFSHMMTWIHCSLSKLMCLIHSAFVISNTDSAWNSKSGKWAQVGKRPLDELITWAYLGKRPLDELIT